MVHEGIVNYLKTGVERGFTLDLLKQKLLEGGFLQNDIDEAIHFLESQKHVQPQAPQSHSSQQFSQREETHEHHQQAAIAAQGLSQNEVSPGKTKWMHIAMISGYILFGFALLLFAYSFFGDLLPAGPADLAKVAGGGVPPSADSFSSVSLIFFLVGTVVLLVLIFFYYYGFTRLGKAIPSKLLKISSWVLIVLGVVLIVLLVILTVYIFQLFSDPLALSALEGVSGTVFVLLRVLFSVFFVTNIFVLLFSFALIRSRQLKFALVTGILFLVGSVLGLISAGTYGYALFVPDSLIDQPFLVDVVTNGVYEGSLVLLFVLGVLVGSLTLRHASIRYEPHKKN